MDLPIKRLVALNWASKLGGRAAHYNGERTSGGWFPCVDSWGERRDLGSRGIYHSMPERQEPTIVCSIRWEAHTIRFRGGVGV